MSNFQEISVASFKFLLSYSNVTKAQYYESSKTKVLNLESETFQKGLLSPLIKVSEMFRNLISFKFSQ